VGVCGVCMCFLFVHCVCGVCWRMCLCSVVLCACLCGVFLCVVCVVCGVCECV